MGQEGALQRLIFPRFFAMLSLVSQVAGNTSQGASATSQNQSTDASKPSWYGKTIDQMTDAELREYVEATTGVHVVDPDTLSVDSEAAKNLDLQG